MDCAGVGLRSPSSRPRPNIDRLLSSALALVYSAINANSYKANLTLARDVIEAGPTEAVTVAKSDEAR